jgi:hypothetical protein
MSLIESELELAKMIDKLKEKDRMLKIKEAKIHELESIIAKVHAISVDAMYFKNIK